jgi:hypothetical protein
MALAGGTLAPRPRGLLHEILPHALVGGVPQLAAAGPAAKLRVDEHRRPHPPGPSELAGRRDGLLARGQGAAIEEFDRHGARPRKRRRVAKMRLRLGGDQTEETLPPKPKRMWWRTYERLCQTVAEAELAEEKALLQVAEGPAAHWLERT